MSSLVAGDAVRINTPGESAHGLFGVVDRVIGSTGDVFVLINEYGDIWKYQIHELEVIKNN